MRSIFYQDTHGVQMRDGEEPWRPHTPPGRGQGWARALGACGPLGALQPPPFRLLIPPDAKTLDTRAIIHEKF